MISKNRRDDAGSPCLLFGDLERRRFAGLTTCTVAEAGLNGRQPTAARVCADILAGHLSHRSLYDVGGLYRSLVSVHLPDREVVLCHAPVIRTLIP
jgi:hypothetical protein